MGRKKSEFRKKTKKSEKLKTKREDGTQGTYATGEQDQRVQSDETGQNPDDFVANKRGQGASWTNAVGAVHLRRLWLGHFRDCDEDQCVCAKLESFLINITPHIQINDKI